MATYHWLADGTKYRVEDASGNGVIYAGDLTYAVTGSGGNTTYALESAEASADGTARFLKNGTAMTPYYTIRDHLGSVRTIVNASGTVVERNDYYPFGTRTTFGASYPTLSINRQKFSGKEDQGTIGSSTLPYLDFGARMYDAKLVRWNTYDPMAEKYYGINPYVYCAGDPVNHIDPKGQSLIGWLLAYKAVAAGMEHFGRTSDTKTIGFGMQRPITALRVGFSSAKHNNISSISTRFASDITISAQMDNSPTLSPGNALRHVIWQALITREFGNNTAKRIGNAHEERSKDAEYQADTFVDQKNNVIGRLIGDDSKNSSNVEIVLKVLEYYRDIGLWISIKQQDGTYKNEQSRMTEEQFKLAVDRLQKLNEDARENNH